MPSCRLDCGNGMYDKNQALDPERIGQLFDTLQQVAASDGQPKPVAPTGTRSWSRVPGVVSGPAAAPPRGQVSIPVRDPAARTPLT